MKRSRLALLLVLGMLAALIPVASAAPALGDTTSDLVISGVIDGPLSGGTPKAIEVTALNDIADLSIYGLGSANNGGGTDGEEFTFPADSASAGDVLYVATESSLFEAFFGCAPDYTNGSAPSINGDDAVELFMSGAVVDVFGDINVDGTGEPWDHLDGWAKRVGSTGPDGSSFVLANWTFSGPNALDGESSNSTAATPYDYEGTCEPPPPPLTCQTPEADLTLISEVQGSGWDSPLHGVNVTIRAVVTVSDADLDGYFVQEEPEDDDQDPATSEGLFIYDPRSQPSVGQTVELNDYVTSYYGLTQLSYPDTEICDTAHVDIEATPLTLPLDDVGRESLEGMLITNAQDLQVTGLFSAYAYGELGLAYMGPLANATSVFAPNDPQVNDLVDANADAELKVNDRNEAYGSYNPYPWEYFDEDLSAGDTMASEALVGALGYNFGEYKVEPINTAFFPETEDTFERPDAPSLAGGNDVAAFNVLNFFNTFGSRGASNQAEFDLQTAKIVDAIIRLDAAVVGLMEIENDYEDFYDDDDSTVPSIVTLVDALNAVSGKNTWAYVRPNENILTMDGDGGLGPDQIAVGIIYQKKRARAVGTANTFNIDALLEGDYDNNRWPLAQTFKIDGKDVTVVVNHFKSKGSSCTDTAGPGFDYGDDVGTSLTGNCDLTRQYAANRLVEWVDDGATNKKTKNVLLIGDFNAYEEEAPIEILVDAKYVDLVQRDGGDAFTYKFSGRYGRLDYVFASPALASSVIDAEVWQINSPAPYGYLYYNDPIDETAHASSDHDPVVIAIG